MENTLVGDFPNMGLLEEYWLGGMFIGRIQGWTWADGRPLCYANWANGQPRNESGVCVAFASASRRWYARDCKAEKPFICKLADQKRASTPESETCAQGWAYVNGTSKCYKVVIAFNKEGHETLWDKCKKTGGKVASIHSAEENAALTAFVNGSITHEFRKDIQWFVFGLYSADGGLNWQWKDGSPLDYVNWAPDEPNTWRDTKQKCAVVPFDGGPVHSLWGDVHCTAVSEWSATATLCMRNPRR
ncbi:CLEC-51 protein [Aphelenchoides avenae]|nr:CLEC-51 protein [Aphelenchus avenae]